MGGASLQVHHVFDQNTLNHGINLLLRQEHKAILIHVFCVLELEKEAVV